MTERRMPAPSGPAPTTATVDTAKSSRRLSTADAQRLDQRIRLMANSIGESLSKLYGLIEEAKAGQIHMALGYASWTAYIAEACRINVRIDRDQRREIVGWLSGQGMAQRSIAEVIGASVATVNADLQGVQNRTPDEPAEVEDHLVAAGYFTDDQDAVDCLTMADIPADRFDSVLADARVQGDLSRQNVVDLCRKSEPKSVGADGKSYPRQRERRRTPLIDDAGRLADDMRKLTNRIDKLLGDDRFPPNRGRIADRIRPYDEWLAQAAQQLHQALGGDVE